MQNPLKQYIEQNTIRGGVSKKTVEKSGLSIVTLRNISRMDPTTIQRIRFETYLILKYKLGIDLESYAQGK